MAIWLLIVCLSIPIAFGQWRLLQWLELGHVKRLLVIGAVGVLSWLAVAALAAPRPCPEHLYPCQSHGADLAELEKIFLIALLMFPWLCACAITATLCCVMIIKHGVDRVWPE